MSLFSRVWIKVHFPLKGPVIYYFQIFIEVICQVSCTRENKEVSSANSFTLVVRSSVRSLMYNKNKKGPRMESCGTPALISSHVETCPLRTTRCFLSILTEQHHHLLQCLSLVSFPSEWWQTETSKNGKIAIVVLKQIKNRS